MTPVEIKKDIYWVGAIDWNIRDFHGYEIPQGTSYNAYLVVDEKTVLFDTVKRGFEKDLMTRIAQIIDPKKIDYIVINHIEADHAGSLPEIAREVNPEKVICSVMGERGLREHYEKLDIPLETVKTDDVLNTGKRNIRFIESKMLHWPDSMCSWLEEDKVLISNDIFGQHWATSGRFDDEVPFDELMYQSASYYANIVLPYSPLVLKFIKLVQEKGINPELLATDHGVIWRKHIPVILEKYQFWAEGKSKPKVVVVYDSMWGSTDKMAKAIEKGVYDEDVEIRLVKAGTSHRSVIIAEIMDAAAVVFGSSTLNNGILPAMADVLTYTKGLRPAKKLGAAFGSYGWGGESVKILNGWMEDMKFEIVDEGIRSKYVPFEDDLNKCYELGKKIARLVKKMS